MGFAPEAIGVAFSMNEGELTKPIKIDDGLIIIQLNGLVQADSLQSYSDYGTSLLQANKFTSSLKIEISLFLSRVIFFDSIKTFSAKDTLLKNNNISINNNLFFIYL